MCGRFTLTDPIPWIAELLGAHCPEGGAGLAPRYNVAPGTDIPIIRAHEDQARALGLVRWGLVPFWAKDAAFGARTINARSETAAQKPAFRAAFRHRRCLIPADGFYEWAGEGREKRPHFIHLPGRAPFAFAGLWERWSAADGAVLDTCAILTTQANERLAALHHRMPVILPESAYADWLNPRESRPKALGALLQPYPPEGFAYYPVGDRVNRPENDDAACLERRSVQKDAPGRQGSLFGAPGAGP